MTGLLGPNGQPISSKMFFNKKSPAPATGDKYGRWGGPEAEYFRLPGGGALQFNLDQLTLSDYRQMRDHYQINSSLTVLMFLMHQMEWRIECSNKKQQDFYTEQLNGVWTPLVRSKSQAFWAGFSPNVLNWANDTPSRRITLEKVKDLTPEECLVNWKKVDAANNQKINVYDGIQQYGAAKPIPVENTYWYPMLAENGNYYGRKLLRSAFQSWFFSILLHLFANRYYERFGEPTPIGRAPFEDDIRFGGQSMQGNEAMDLILTQLRNRSTVVLPNDKTQFGDESTLDYDYQIEYLESQMRGADFERYMTRLDEEMSLALFTPILLMRTADVGSYNLGDMQSVIYQWMLNAIAGDWKFYIDWYLLKPLRDLNFGMNAEMPTIKFTRLGARNQELVNNVIASLVSKDKIKFNYDQLGEIAGLDVSEVKALTGDPAADPATDPATQDPAQTGQDTPSTGDTATENRVRVHRVAQELSKRVENQTRNAFRKNTIKDTQFSLGFQRQFEDALVQADVENPSTVASRFYDQIEMILDTMVDVYDNADVFMQNFNNTMTYMVNQILKDVEG